MNSPRCGLLNDSLANPRIFLLGVSLVSLTFQGRKNCDRILSTMNSDLDSLLDHLRQGKNPSAVLIFGDDFQVHMAGKAVLEQLVPLENRDLLLERFDGRVASWEEIEGALMTPPLFPGTKTVFVENVPYFLARERKAEVGERVLQLWHGGKQEEAARLLLDLLILEGWTREQWERVVPPATATSVAETLGLGGESGRDTLRQVLDFARDSAMPFPQRKGGGDPRLTDLLNRGIPPWSVLLMTASQVDRRTALYRKFTEKGIAVNLQVARERSGKIQWEDLTEFLDRLLKETGKEIEERARALILQRAGEELWSFHRELEKVILHVGDESCIRVENVEEVFLDRGESWVFDLTASISQRNPLAALQHLARLLSQGEHPLRLLGTMVGEVRRLLSARQLLEGELHHQWKSGMSFAQFQRQVLKGGAPMLGRHPYGDYLLLQRAEVFSISELLQDLDWIRDADVRLKSTGTPPRMVLERLILQMCRGEESARASARPG